VASTTAAIPRKLSRLSRKAWTGDLVGRVEHARRRASGGRRLAGESQAGERLDVDGLEGQRPDLLQPQAAGGELGEVGVMQRVGDRDAHVGQAQVRQLGAVAGLHQRVHDGLRGARRRPRRS
jgi:hypothetical protein